VRVSGQGAGEGEGSAATLRAGAAVPNGSERSRVEGACTGDLWPEPAEGGDRLEGLGRNSRRGTAP
jgi:hypothetical protein